MNLMIFGLVLIVLCFNTSYRVDNTPQVIDLLPDFIGYLILWVGLEKRRVNKRIGSLYTAVSVMTLISFLFFLGQIKIFFANALTGNLTWIGWLLDGVTYVTINFSGLVLLVGVLILAWLLFGLLEYWEQNEQHKLQRTVCKIGMGLCGIAGLCHLGSVFVILPFSWNWIAYPASLLAIAAAWFVMKDSQEMLTGSKELVKERTFGGKK
ncbi:MAG: hypothetical protein J6B86_03505 [Clostridia bacterium]|nr:hypothetical protein [Clostridia bacterium]